MRSPVVLIGTISSAKPGNASDRRRLVSFACQSASGEPRVPIRNISVM
jgi:hypothetical protein